MLILLILVPMLTKVDFTNNKGFTLIEVLIVLSMISLFLVIGASFQPKALEQNQADYFFKLFQSDVLYLQQLTMIDRENVFIYISPDNKSYQIKRGGMGEVILTRSFPKDWTINLNTLPAPISFSPNGTIKNPGTIDLRSPTTRYSVIFPFGKGRCYIVEAER
ncbi:prepilin-type N-terminal cleavage/methylation domain-containing protein [Aquibacillus koreensis]|uniref:Prepilin-type N-terminal cleavage/methylation domain-containing protein n=2 Tax=Aquibacillus koreensis TaxID=279446 RepID=A0A9X3WI99_9BACI|nr:competence type IV pilus minor pilin ComGD [Aquibacillus koreensis]MDC3418995.1 prepilin-type N-terminal cleavage/methylation domain-containing protein [Aquibacillus koreensis]